MKRWYVMAALAVVAAIIGVTIAREPVFWKRYILAATHSHTTLPKSFYEPGDVISGSDQPEAPRVTPELQQLDPQALKAAADYAGTHDTTALIVSRRGHIVFEQYWDGQRSEGTVDLGEANSVVAALMVGIAMGDRKIALVAEPVANYLQEFRNDESNAITIQNLLQSASGSDVQLLALIVERAARQPYARYIAEHLWKPIGAADALLARENESGAPRIDCCLRARRGDWMRIAELLVSDGHFQGEQIVPPGWVREMLAPSKANKHFGYQVWRGVPFTPESAAGASERYAADDTYLLRGAGKSRLWFVPSLRLAILRTGTNAESDTDWDDARIPNLVVRGARDFVPKEADPNDLSRLVPNH